LHPLIYENLSKINTVFNKILKGKQKFSIDDGMLIESDSGGTGLTWLIENWDKVKFNKYRTEKNKVFVDFINMQIKAGVALEKSVVESAKVRAKPIILTGVAAMMGAFFILDDPIFNGLAISLISGILISTMLTLVLIPVLYFSYLSRFKTLHE
ncbi:MAG: efflux RND transporter permease subunit, partial [Kangiellaceae bacterium]|nr:efflux RND transporter permease subunit [Kangiellaceae bacterium]